jgi:fibronectin type 3 domain-containing protein
VTFAPTTAGAVSGANVTIASNATNSPTVISLSGAGTHSVALSWAPSTTSGVAYNVYRGTAPGTEGTTPLNSSSLSGTSFTDVNVTSGAAYYYVVHAVNSNGTSGSSNEVQVSVPTP